MKPQWVCPVISLVNHHWLLDLIIYWVECQRASPRTLVLFGYLIKNQINRDDLARWLGEERFSSLVATLILMYKRTKQSRKWKYNLTGFLVNVVEHAKKQSRSCNLSIYINIGCVCPLRLKDKCGDTAHSSSPKIIKDTPVSHCVHWVTCSFLMMNVDTILYVQSTLHTVSWCLNYSPEHRMCIHPPLKIIPNKYSV